MAKVMIWPDLYREQGHWLPCINLAKSLQDAGYDVEFMGIPDCASIVEPYGATFHTILESIYPIGHSVENKLDPPGQRWKPAHVLPIVRGALDSIFTGSGAPDLLVSGYFNALETLLIHYKYDIPVVTITTFLRHPDDDPAMHAKTKLVFMSDPLQRKIIEGVTEPNADGSEVTLEQFIRPLELEIHPELIPCPREFDFFDADWEHRDNTHYVEPMIERAVLSGEEPAIEPIEIPADKRLIYGTAGSQVQDYSSKAREFFKGLIAMMQTSGMDQYHLILGVGERLLAQLQTEYGVNTSNNRLPANVQLFDWVSQLDILQDADVVFMHGGLATIKESIWEEVPIVILPHGKDQQENAMRIKRAGIGISSNGDAFSPLELRKLLTKATSSTWLRANLSKMRAIFEARENASPKRSIELIQGVVAP